MKKWLRLYLVNGDSVDVDIQGKTAEEALDMSKQDYVHGRHVGDNPCVVPQKSILWAEIIKISYDRSGTVGCA